MPKKKLMPKRDVLETIKIERIVFEVFEYESNKPSSKKTKKERILDQYSISTPEDEGQVLAEAIRLLVYLYDRTMQEMFSRISTYLSETRLENFDDYMIYMPEDYFHRFFVLNPDGDSETLEEAVTKAKEQFNTRDLLFKEKIIDTLSEFEKIDFNDWELSYSYAGIYNYILNQWNNYELAEIIHSYYFIS
jgi:hypothetical protein